MKKFFIVLLAILAVFIVAYFSIGDFNYEVDVLFFRAFGKLDGIYCTPFRCVDLIHDGADLMHQNLVYMEEYGPYDPARPGLLYKYYPEIKSYVRWLYW